MTNNISPANHDDALEQLHKLRGMKVQYSDKSQVLYVSRKYQFTALLTFIDKTPWPEVLEAYYFYLHPNEAR